jgi:type I restriction enzyme M protein
LARRTRNTNPQANIASANQSIFTSPDEHLDISMLETWLWDAACAIRGSTDAPKFKDFILPLVFFKRLSDVFDDEFATHVKEYGDEATAREIIEADLAHALKTGTTPIICFYIHQRIVWVYTIFGRQIQND